MTSDYSKVLWVDDDARGVLSPIAGILRKYGISLDVATSYEEAVERMTQQDYSAIMIDVIIPHSSSSGALHPLLGLDLIKQIHSNIPIVILSVVRLAEIKDQIGNLDVKYFDKTELFSPHVFEQLAEALRNPRSNISKHSIIP